jgi:hypothetical protein
MTVPKSFVYSGTVPTISVTVQDNKRTRLKLFKLPQIKQFSSQAFHTWHIPSPCHPHYMCTSPPSKFTVKVICGPWLLLKVFCIQVKVFQTAQYQRVFNADLPYLVHTFTMSSPFHTHVCNFQGQGRTFVFVFVFLLLFFVSFAYIQNFNVFKCLCKSNCVGIGGINVLLTYLVVSCPGILQHVHGYRYHVQGKCPYLGRIVSCPPKVESERLTLWSSAPAKDAYHIVSIDKSSSF